MIWNQTAAGSGQANWEAGSQVNSEQARLSNFDWAKISSTVERLGIIKWDTLYPTSGTPVAPANLILF